MQIKYRVGVMPGPWPPGPGGAGFLWQFVELCETTEIDSLWFSERLSSPLPVPKPIQQPMPAWIGGNSEAAMRRAGRLGDGWIPSFIPPDRFAVGVAQTQRFAAEAGREVPVDHFGTLVNFCFAPDRAAARALAGPFIPRNRVDDATLETCTAFGPPALLRELLVEYASAGGSKIISRQICTPDRFLEQLHPV